MSRFLPSLLRILFWTAATELLLLRLFLRLGPVLPIQEPLIPLYHAIETLGLVAMNLGMLAGLTLLAVLAGTLAWRRTGDLLLGVGLLTALAGLLTLRIMVDLAPAGVAVVLYALFLTLPTLAALRLSARLPRGRAAVMLAVGAQLFALYHVFAQAFTSLGYELPDEGMAVFVAEVLAVASAISLPWSLGVRPRVGDIRLGIGVAVVVAGGLFTVPWILATVAMWTVSFSLFLPGPVYVLAAGIATSTLWAARRERAVQPLARAIVLIALGGVKLDFTYYALLSIAGTASACLFGEEEGKLLIANSLSQWKPHAMPDMQPTSLAGR